MNAVYLLLQDVAPAIEHDWRAWMLAVHVPEVLREPGFVGARLYRVEGVDADGWRRYAVIYELVSRAALDAYLSGPAVVRLRAAFVAHCGDRVRVTRLLLTPEAELLPEQQADIGP